MSPGSLAGLLVIIAAVVVVSIVAASHWPRIRGRRQRHQGVPAPSVLPPMRSAAALRLSDPSAIPQLGKSTTLIGVPSDPTRPSVWVEYYKPGEDEVSGATYRCNLAGINHIGWTGEHRQVNIRGLKPGQNLIPIRHRDNAYDEHAVLILTEAGKDVGYLPAHMAEEIAPLDRKRAVTAVVDEVEEFTSTGGNRLLGGRITLTTYKPRPKSTKAKSSKGVRQGKRNSRLQEPTEWPSTSTPTASAVSWARPRTPGSACPN